MLESHISGWGASKTVTARTMVDRLQAALTGLLDVQALGAELETQFGQLLALRAASAVLTTNSCEKPSSCAVIRRSTPGSTDGHVATAPSSTGSRQRRRPGQTRRPAGSLHPHQRLRVPTAGERQFHRRRRGIHRAVVPARERRIDVLSSSCPTGSTPGADTPAPPGSRRVSQRTSRDSPRCETTSTGSPDFFARRIASLSETA